VERPAALRRAAVLLTVEALALATLGVVGAIVATSDDRAGAVGIAGVAVAVGLVLVLLGRAVGRQRAWARTPSIVLQLLALPVGTDQARSGVWLAAVPVLLLAGATLYHLVAMGGPDRS
jgi:hypothetical protein